MQFTYVCRSQDTHVVCIDGTNFNVREAEESQWAKGHGRYLEVRGINVYQTLYFKAGGNANHLAEVVRAIEIARFIWQHTNRLKLSPEVK
ncbi:MAG: hypothetical protein U5L02_06205 [Rheinheimera sp.]|nr:hypothetical protein [Rheinheimera sp.]